MMQLPRGTAITGTSRATCASQTSALDAHLSCGVSSGASQPALVWGQQLLQRKRLQKAAGGERIDANQARPLSLAIRAEGGRAV